MRYEHFGIAIVELMAAGIVTIAHESGGPKLDIIGKRDEACGYLAEKQEDYVEYVVRSITKFNDTYHT